MTDPNALAGIVFTYLDKLSKATLSVARRARTENLHAREFRAITDPETGALLGYEQRKAGTTTASITDMEALLPYVADSSPAELRDVEDYPARDPEILALLRQHLPEKLTATVEITSQHLNYLTKKAASDEAFRPPGIAVTTGEGTTAFLVENPEAIEAMVNRGAFSLAAPVKPELESPDGRP